MNQDETPSSSAGRGESPSGRPPIDTGGVFSAPPPPPGYPPYVAPPRERRGVFAVLGKVIGAVSVALVLIALGYYGALATVLAGRGKVATELYRAGAGLEKIAIIPVEGLIMPETAGFIHDAVDTALADPNVKAIVLWVDSGGGLVGPSEQIYHEISRLKTAGLPVVAAYGSLAASGGYYVSCQADYIIAQPVCVTGSIGVIAQLMTFEDLLTKKLGIEPVVMAAAGSPDKVVANQVFRSWDQADRDELQHTLNAMYRRFVTVVEAGRVKNGPMTPEQLERVTTGRAYMAEEAVADDHKLIDAIGYLDDAIEAARTRAGLSEARPPVVRYGVPKGVSVSISRADAPSPPTLAELDGRKIRRLMMELGTPEAMYLYQP